MEITKEELLSAKGVFWGVYVDFNKHLKEIINPVSHKYRLQIRYKSWNFPLNHKLFTERNQQRLILN